MTIQLPRPRLNPFQSRMASVFKPLNALWDKLTSPSPKITELGDQRIAKLAASFLLIIFMLSLIGVAVSGARIGIITALRETFGLLLTLILISYFVARTKWYRVSIFLFALSFSSTAFSSILSEGASVNFSLQVLLYIPLSLIVASAFLSGWAVFLLTGINVAIMFSGPLFGLPFPDEIEAMTGIITTTGLVLIALTNFRNTLENDRVAEVRLANRTLENLADTLEQRVAERTRNLELAVEVGRTVSRVRALDEMLKEACELILKDFNLYYVQVYFTDYARNELVLQSGTGDVASQLLEKGHRLALDTNSINGRAALQKRPMVVANTEKDPAFKANPLLPETRSEMAIPLLVGDHVAGVLDMQSTVADSLRQDLLPAFEALVGQLSIAIQNANLFAEIQKTRAEVEAQAHQTQLALAQSEKLYQISNRLTHASGYSDMTKIFAEGINIPVINRITIDLFNHDDNENLISADVVANWWSGHGSKPYEVGMHYTPETFRLMKLFTSRTALFFNDTLNDPRIDPESLEVLKSLNICAGVVLPLYTGARQAGVVIAQAEKPYLFTQEEVILLNALAPQVATVIENRRQFESAQEQAKRETTLNIISQKIQNATTVEAVLQIAARELGHVLGTETTVAQLSMKDSR